MKTKLNLFILLIAGSIFANNYYVAPNGKNISPYSTWENAALNIKDAVALANNGDAVIISNGAYTIDEHIVIDKPITVKSLNGFEETLIDCNHNSRAFLVTADNTVIDGITIEKGNTYINSDENRGGAIYLDCDVATIINSSFITNFGSLGGAIYAKADSLISNCVFKYNRASVSGGGAIYTYRNNSRVNIVDCEFSYNWCLGWGGGAIVAADYTKISNCVIHDNRSGNFGGGVYMRDSAIIEDSLVYNNVATQDNGGGIWSQYIGGGRVPLISNCIISNNSAGILGGGVFLEKQGNIENSVVCNNSAIQGGGIAANSVSVHREHSNVDNCVIYGNYAEENGGGYFHAWFGILKNCLIYNNSSGINGGGATLWNDGQLINCTIVSNSCDSGNGGVYFYNDNNYTTGTGSVLNCVIYFNKGSNYDISEAKTPFDFTCTTPLVSGTGNIDNDPMFIDKAANNYKLLSASPCINNGFNTNWMVTAKDLAGNARVLDEIVDMGAYETALGLWCDFAADKLSVLPDSEVIFSSNVQGTNVINLVYDWNFLAIGENLSIVTNTYITEGLYDVSLTVSNNVGETYTCSKLDYIEVVPEPSLFLIFNLLVIYWHRKLIFIK